jgi:hypothetical protein
VYVGGEPWGIHQSVVSRCIFWRLLRSLTGECRHASSRVDWAQGLCEVTRSGDTKLVPKREPDARRGAQRWHRRCEALWRHFASREASRCGERRRLGRFEWESQMVLYTRSGERRIQHATRSHVMRQGVIVAICCRLSGPRSRVLHASASLGRQKETSLFGGCRQGVSVDLGLVVLENRCLLGIEHWSSLGQALGAEAHCCALAVLWLCLCCALRQPRRGPIQFPGRCPSKIFSAGCKAVYFIDQ